jgi:hypothetical protein
MLATHLESISTTDDIDFVRVLKLLGLLWAGWCAHTPARVPCRAIATHCLAGYC